jgi:hypothetical protein
MVNVFDEVILANLSEAYQTFLKAGWIDKSGSFTVRGRTRLRLFQLHKFTKELVEYAKSDVPGGDKPQVNPDTK